MTVSKSDVSICGVCVLYKFSMVFAQQGKKSYDDLCSFSKTLRRLSHGPQFFSLKRLNLKLNVREKNVSKRVNIASTL